MKIGSKGLELIKSFESFVPYVYDDFGPPVKGKYRPYKKGDPVKGTLTCLFGHTDAAKHPLKMKDAIGKTFTEKFGLEVLDVDLDECEDAVTALVKVQLSQGQFDALVSFAFNCGIGNLKKLIVPLNKKDYDGCRKKFGEFIRSKGEVMRGLVRRRNAEQALWDDPYVEGKVQPVEVVPKAKDSNASQGPVEKLLKSKMSWAGLGGACAPVLSAFTDWKIAAVCLGFTAFLVLLYLRSRKS